VRRGSPTFGQYASAKLDEESGGMLWIPPGLAHGFQALEDSLVVYMVTHNEYAPERSLAVSWYLEAPYHLPLL